jgi:hypothetical protein
MATLTVVESLRCERRRGLECGMYDTSPRLDIRDLQPGVTAI